MDTDCLQHIRNFFKGRILNHDQRQKELLGPTRHGIPWYRYSTVKYLISFMHTARFTHPHSKGFVLNIQLSTAVECLINNQTEPLSALSALEENKTGSISRGIAGDLFIHLSTPEIC